MRTLIGVIAVLGFSSFAPAEDGKIDGKKLVGKWVPSEEKSPLVLEFTEKGKVILSIDLGGKTEKVEGSYKLDGDKLEMAMTFTGKEMKDTITILKLTDDEWAGKDTKGKEEKFKRFKAK